MIPRRFFAVSAERPHSLSDIDAMLSSALRTCGYPDKAYYAVPDGFALVTPFEKIDPDGTPSKERFGVDSRPFPRSFVEYIKALLLPNPGYYRTIVFVVTSRAFSPSEAAISQDQAQEWGVHGGNRLPVGIGRLEWTAEHDCTVLIYEFDKPDDPLPSALRIPGRLHSREHLVKAGLWTVWEWFLPNVVPTLSLIAAVLAFDAFGKTHLNDTVDGFLFCLTGGLSALYLLMVALPIFARPFIPVASGNWAEFLGTSSLWLGPLQGIVAVFLGVFFVKKPNQ